MCGRYVLYSDKQTLTNHFKAPFKSDESFYQPSWNIAPGSINPVMLLGKAREPGMAPMRWGLVPSFAKDESMAYKMINARGETIAEKPSFKKSFQRKRCLIPANGFYEWKKIEGTDKKLPFYIRLVTDELFAFAGIFDFWQSADGKELFTYSIITTEANTLLQPLHERMPVILNPKDYKTWVDPMNDDSEGLKSLLKPWPTESMRVYRISDDVNKTSNNTPELLKPIV